MLPLWRWRWWLNIPILEMKSQWHWLHGNVSGRRSRLCWVLLFDFFICYPGGVKVFGFDANGISPTVLDLGMCFNRFRLKSDDLHCCLSWYFYLRSGQSHGLFFVTIHKIVVQKKKKNWPPYNIYDVAYNNYKTSLQN